LTLNTRNAGTLEHWNPGTLERWNLIIGNRKSLKISYFQFSISSTKSRYENQNTLIGNGKSEIGNPWNSGTLEHWNIGTLEHDAIVLNPITKN
jgi:hypothetical protein